MKFQCENLMCFKSDFKTSIFLIKLERLSFCITLSFKNIQLTWLLYLLKINLISDLNT